MFYNLHSLAVDGISSGKLIKMLKSLATLPRLLSLTINAYNFNGKSSNIYQLIFSLPHLKSNKLIIDEDDSSISLRMAANQQISSIEYFIIDHNCVFNDILILLSYTPQIRRLKFFNTNYIDQSLNNFWKIKLINLTHICLEMCYVEFYCLEMFITKIDCNLKCLSINNIQCQDMNYLNSIKWEKLIMTSFPELRKFYLKYIETINEQGELELYDGEPNQFISCFWIDHQWRFEVEILIGNQIIYTIKPNQYVKKIFFI